MTDAAEEKSVDPSLIGTAEDYQLARAVDMLRGISLFNGRVDQLSASRACGPG